MTGKYCGKDKDDRDSKWDFFILANFSHIESLSSLFTTQRKTSRFENPVSHDSPPAMTHEGTGTLSDYLVIRAFEKLPGYCCNANCIDGTPGNAHSI